MKIITHFFHTLLTFFLFPQIFFTTRRELRILNFVAIVRAIATKFQSFTHQRCLFHRFAVFYLTSGS